MCCSVDSQPENRQRGEDIIIIITSATLLQQQQHYIFYIYLDCLYAWQQQQRHQQSENSIAGSSKYVPHSVSQLIEIRMLRAAESVSIYTI